MLWFILACSTSPPLQDAVTPPSNPDVQQDTGTPDDDTGTPDDDTGTPVDTSTSEDLDCPQYWNVEITVEKELAGCGLPDTRRLSWCTGEDSFSFRLDPYTSLTFDCTTQDDGTFACEVHDGGAHWGTDATARGTVTSQHLTGSWTMFSEWESGDGLTINSCHSRGTVVATPLGQGARPSP